MNHLAAACSCLRHKSACFARKRHGKTVVSLPEQVSEVQLNQVAGSSLIACRLCIIITSGILFEVLRLLYGQRMRFSPFLITLLVMLSLLAVGKLLPYAGFTHDASRMVYIWATMFTLSLIVMGVTRIGMQFFGPVFCHGRRRVSKEHRPTVALTFDDGPDAVATPALLKLLAEYDVKATFFCVGKHVRKHPEIAKQMVEQGHQVQNHTDTHAWSLNFALGLAWRRELSEAQNAIEEATGRRPRFMRPPMGLTNPHLHTELHKLDLLMVGWDVRSFDTLGKSASKVIARVVSRTRPGSVVLLHDGQQDADRVCEIARGVIETLRNKGFSFMTIGEMVDTSQV